MEVSGAMAPAIHSPMGEVTGSQFLKNDISDNPLPAL